ncbi:unnamed protein product [Choristocarpus tenellus]
MGKGATASVRRARDQASGEEVAMKVFSKLPGLVALDRLEGEARCLSRINHTSVIGLRGASKAAQLIQGGQQKVQRVPVLALELASNGELFPFIATGGALPGAAARAVFRQLLDALDACHKASICHRDVSLMNIMVDNNFNLKLGDFGHAVQIPAGQSPTLIRGSCGTGVFAPPEILTGKAHNGFKVDVWAAGVVLFIALTGHPPWSAASPSDCWYSVLIHEGTDAFWAAHCRTSPNIPHGAMDLLSDIFTVDQHSRPSLAWVQTHAWLCRDEGREDNATLIAELKRRSKEMKKTMAGATGSDREGSTQGDTTTSRTHR